MKNVLIASLLFSGAAMFASCNGSSTSSTSPADSSSMSTAGTTDTMSKMQKDSSSMATKPAVPVDAATMDFANKAATGGMAEVEMGKLAEQKAGSQQVKDFGKMMVEDHTKANDNFMAIAKAKDITLPATITDAQKKDMDELSQKSGKDFDKAYVNMMVDDHKDDIKEFKDAEGKVADNDVKTFITTTLPVLQKHMDAINAIKAKM